jgi:outer membrane protein
MIRTFFTLAYLLLMAIFATIQAQDVWSLEKCITYAIDNNIQIKQGTLQTQYQQNNVRQSKNSRLPNLNAQVSQNMNFGRSLTYDNTYQNINSAQSDFGVSTAVPIFQGLQINNNLRRTEFDLRASLEDLEKAKDDLSVNIASSFLEILFAKELVKVAQEQLDITKQQIKQTEEKVEAGSLARGALLEIQAQAAREELNLINAQNQLQLANLQLAQLLELESHDKFEVEVPELPEIAAQSSLVAANEVYLTAIKERPEIKGAEFRLESTKYQLKAAQGVLYPSIAFFANFYNLYNNKYQDVNGESISFSDQLANNGRTGLGVQMNIPIFNRLQNKLQIDNARIQVMNTELELESSKKLLRKDIETAQTNALAALNKYLSSDKAVASMKEAFRYSEEKYNVGIVNAVEYNTAKTSLAKASSDLLQAKYEFIFRTKILDFYRGLPITL